MYFVETCLSSSVERGVSVTLQCAEFSVVSCKDLNETMQKHFPQDHQVKVYQHWFCGQSPGKDICYVGWHGPKSTFVKYLNKADITNKISFSLTGRFWWRSGVPRQDLWRCFFSWGSCQCV